MWNKTPLLNQKYLRVFVCLRTISLNFCTKWDSQIHISKIHSWTIYKEIHSSIWHPPKKFIYCISCKVTNIMNNLSYWTSNEGFKKRKITEKSKLFFTWINLEMLLFQEENHFLGIVSVIYILSNFHQVLMTSTI